MVNITPASAFADVVFAAELGVSLLNLSSDAVAVYDTDFNQVFKNARPMRVEVRPSARLMDHPVENGQVNTDYKIILPTEIVLPVLIPAPYYRNTYQEIWNLWTNSTLLNVQTKTSNYFNMVITEPPHEETPERFDAIMVRLRMRQIQVVNLNNNFFPVNAVDADIKALGEQLPSIYTILGSAAGAATTALTIAAELR